MNGRIKNKVGIRYDRLIVIKFVSKEWDGFNSYTLWKCKCDCGNEIIVRANNLQGGNVKSCGCLHREKSSKRMSKMASGRIRENSPAYVNGKYCGKYTKEIYELKEKIRKRDNYTCQECGVTQKEYREKYNRKLDVHHIDGDDTNNDPENMVTVCKGCHKKLERKLKKDEQNADL